MSPYSIKPYVGRSVAIDDKLSNYPVPAYLGYPHQDLAICWMLWL